MIRRLASLQLTIFCLIGAMILVFIGTLLEVQHGIFEVQQNIFRTFFVWFHGFPIFPGGYLLAGILILNLASAYIFKFEISWKKLGILCIHTGLGILLFNELYTGLATKESQMPLRIGEISNYSVSLQQVELILIDKSHPHYDEVYSIPEQKLKEGISIRDNRLPFTFFIRKQYDNVSFSNGTGMTFANRGFGTSVTVQPEPKINPDKGLNAFTAFVDVMDQERPIGTWLLSSGISMNQVFEHQGKKYELSIRRKRYYHPFSLKLMEFKHELHPHSDIPSHFSSKVKIFRNDGSFDHKSMISMNEPLRYQGKTFYQASFADNDQISILQVVENPARILPYLSSGLVGFGLLYQFLWSFQRFRRKK